MKTKMYLLLSALGVAIIGLFLPFRMQTLWESTSSKETIITSMNGFDLFLPSFSIPVFIVVGLFVLSTKNTRTTNTVALFVSVLNALYLVLVYMEIHTKSGVFSRPELGIGFYFYCLAALLLIVATVWHVRSSKANNSSRTA